MQFIRDHLKAGRQAYIVYPLIEESEAMDLRNAIEEFEKVKKEFPEFKIGLLHGRMKPSEKDEIMNAFRKNEIQILVSTTVIEVGVDVPNANIMLIEHAERFGLSQLHQLRGRIGRGSEASTCMLLYHEPLSEMSTARLKVIRDSRAMFATVMANFPKLNAP